MTESGRVLVTGATGFIGRPTVPLLRERGFEVHTVSTSPAPEGWTNHHVHDLLRDGSAELMERVRPTHLLHLAWCTAQGYRHSPENYQWVQASLDLAREFARAGGRRLVGAGTCAEYDWSSGVCSEFETPLVPNTPYGICKDAVRRDIESIVAGRDLSFAWGRVFFLYGPGERPHRLVASVVRSLLAGERARCTEGRQVRDMLSIHDAARAFADLLDSGVAGPVNIGSGSPVAVRDVVLTIARQLNAEDRVGFGELPVDDEGGATVIAETRRLREEVGWQPGCDLSSGIAAAIRWWQREREERRW